jgi:hypothetical protein
MGEGFGAAARVVRAAPYALNPKFPRHQSPSKRMKIKRGRSGRNRPGSLAAREAGIQSLGARNRAGCRDYGRRAGLPHCCRPQQFSFWHGPRPAG